MLLSRVEKQPHIAKQNSPLTRMQVELPAFCGVDGGSFKSRLGLIDWLIEKISHMRHSFQGPINGP